MSVETTGEHVATAAACTRTAMCDANSGCREREGKKKTKTKNKVRSIFKDGYKRRTQTNAAKNLG